LPNLELILIPKGKLTVGLVAIGGSSGSFLKFGGGIDRLSEI
jgi:hypothetical protein